MNYEQKYKEALETARKINSGEGVAAPPDWTVYEVIFPELKESMDERIRKSLINLFKIENFNGYTTLNGIDVDDVITWLEKQSESIKIKKGKNYLCTKTHKYAGVEWIKGTKYYASDNYTLVNQECEYYCPEYSKKEHNNFFKEVEYDGCLEKQGDKAQGKTALEAIKEEKIKEEYDGEDYGIDSLYHAQRILEKTLGKVDGYQSDDGILEHKCAISALKKLREQKPKWSEEDEAHLHSITTHLGQWIERHPNTCGADIQCENLAWLESIKQRMEG